jgi:hypothetical protein
METISDVGESRREVYEFFWARRVLLQVHDSPHFKSPPMELATRETEIE